MKLLIVGDSFAADWSSKYPEARGWPNLLAEQHTVTNAAQAGCSEYRIYQQIIHSNIDAYDMIIVSHTSPYRLYTEHNPLRKDDELHHSCDLLYKDVVYLAKKHKDYASVVAYFEKFFSLEYANFCYELMREKIKKLLDPYRSIEITHMPILGSVDIDFSEESKRHPGLINHYDNIGNYKVYERIREKIQSCQ